MHVPAHLLNQVWCETVRLMQTNLRSEVDRLDGATHAEASRSLGDAVATAVSRSVLYDRFRRALDRLVVGAGEASPGCFNAADVWQ